MDDPQFRSLLQKYVDDTISTAELRELFTRIQLPENREAALQMIERLLETADPRPPDRERGDRIFQNVVGVASPTPVKRLLPRYWIAAATVVLLASAYFFSRHTKPTPPARKQTAASADARPAGHTARLTLADGRMIDLGGDSAGMVIRQGDAGLLQAGKDSLVCRANPGPVVYNTVTTPRGAVYDVVLPDGSRASLNAGSSLRFPTAFSGPERKVVVSGEVYFSIVPDKNKPFTVQTTDLHVRVLGTEFDVRAYPDDRDAAATLVSGKIQVGGQRPDVILQPGQVAILADASADIKIKEADMDVALAWRTGWFQFSSADLATVMRELGRWYDVQTSFSGEIPGWHFSGAIQRDIPLSQVLGMLESDDVHFTIEGKTIIVHEKTKQ